MRYGLKQDSEKGKESDWQSKGKNWYGYVPCTSNELNDGSKQKESAIKCQTHVPPVFPKQPIKNFKPLNYPKKNKKKKERKN